MFAGNRSRAVALAVLLAATGGAFAVGRPVQEPAPDPAKADPREADRTAIRGRIKAFLDAFNAADAKALADSWTEEGEYLGEDSDPIFGRGPIGERFAAHFARSSKETARIEHGVIRFLGRDTAMGEGIVVVRPEGASVPNRATYEVIFAREDGAWRIAQLKESTVFHAMIEDLGWLVGDWASTEPGGDQVATNVTWDSHRKFLHIHFIVTHEKETYNGLQIIGVDPATGSLHSWTFGADGGVGEADWEPDGNHWTFQAETTLPDGGTLSATNVLRRIDDNTYTLQSVERSLDGEPLTDMPPVKVTRIKPAK